METEKNSFEETEARSPVDVLIPVAYNFPNLGNVLTLIFVLFAGWFIGTSVPVSQFPVLSTAGIASLFGGPVLAIPFLLDLLELLLEYPCPDGEARKIQVDAVLTLALRFPGRVSRSQLELLTAFCEELEIPFPPALNEKLIHLAEETAHDGEPQLAGLAGSAAIPR